MAEMVVSSVVQEGVNRMSSYISGKLEEKELRENSIARLEMALSRLEFDLERTAEWPITYVYISLIRRRMVLKQVYKEGTDLLEELKLQAVEGGQQIRQWVIDCADKFVTDVESVCPLRHDIFRNPLERQLLEGKSLMYNIKKGSQRYGITLWPVCSEERGTEVMLQYNYVDLNKMQANEVDLNLTLRLSQAAGVHTLVSAAAAKEGERSRGGVSREEDDRAAVRPAVAPPLSRQAPSQARSGSAEDPAQPAKEEGGIGGMRPN
ncbi:hypothetical protein QOZ80_7BG0585180 [Eleusine coracana subsp. coracana]|nr:hypothetical protein QOZ80_7BG0585180 [Eleusine coracana subsp. coracana]